MTGRLTALMTSAAFVHDSAAASFHAAVFLTTDHRLLKVQILPTRSGKTRGILWISPVQSLSYAAHAVFFAKNNNNNNNK